MSFQSSPSLPRRKYGSVEPDAAAASSHLLPRASDQASYDRVREVAGEGERAHGKRWFNLAVVGTLAVGVMVGLAGAGYRLPKNGTESIASPPGSGEINTNLEELPIIPAKAAPPSVKGGSDGGTSNFYTFPKVPSGHVATPDSLEPLSFTALNFYHERDGKPALDYPWLKDVKLIEPHRDTTFSVASPRDGYEYRWTVHGGESDKAGVRAEATGAEAVMVLTTLDDNIITLEEVNPATGMVVRRLEEKTMVKYVRREIRTLTDDEREELFDAVSCMREERGGLSSCMCSQADRDSGGVCILLLGLWSSRPYAEVCAVPFPRRFSVIGKEAASPCLLQTIETS